MLGDNDTYCTGKVQYCQEKQGFIRCSTKIMGKRDIIFFTDEIPSFIRKKVVLGAKVRFRLIVSNQRKNCRGGTIDHWAQITDILGDEEQECLSVSSDSNSALVDDCHPSLQFTAGSVLTKEIETDFFDQQRVLCFVALQDVLNSVHVSLYDRPCNSRCVKNTENASFKSCWDV